MVDILRNYQVSFALPYSINAVSIYYIVVLKFRFNIYIHCYNSFTNMQGKLTRISDTSINRRYKYFIILCICFLYQTENTIYCKCFTQILKIFLSYVDINCWELGSHARAILKSNGTAFKIFTLSVCYNGGLFIPSIFMKTTATVGQRIYFQKLMIL